MSDVSVFHESHLRGPWACVPQVDRVLPAGPVHVINVSPPAGAVVEEPMPELGLNLLMRTGPLLRVGFNRPPRWLAVSPGAMILTPPDTACEFIADAPAHVLAVAIPKPEIEEFTRETGARIEVEREESFRDSRLSQALVGLWHELADDAPAGLVADQLMRTVLATLAGRGGRRLPTGRERLPSHTVRRLRDYVESRLACDIHVTELAEVADLSPAHFARAFAATVGMTPFRYVMTRRLARAKELLEGTRRSALDIALDVGFKTPSHFTSRFRREFGVTPRAIRPDRRRPDVGA